MSEGGGGWGGDGVGGGGGEGQGDYHERQIMFCEYFILKKKRGV